MVRNDIDESHQWSLWRLKTVHQTARGQQAENARNGKAWFALYIKLGMNANFEQIIITAISFEDWTNITVILNRKCPRRWKRQAGGMAQTSECLVCLTMCLIPQQNLEFIHPVAKSCGNKLGELKTAVSPSILNCACCRKQLIIFVEAEKQTNHVWGFSSSWAVTLNCLGL